MTFRSKHRLTLLLILCSLLMPAICYAADGGEPRGNEDAGYVRGMWLWGEVPGADRILENRDGAQDELLTFMQAPHGNPEHAINRLFFEVRRQSNAKRYSEPREVLYDPLLDPDKREDLRAFLRRAKAQGVTVEYLDGQAIWLATDELAEVPKQICRDVVAFNKSTSNPDERLDGVHLDIEPHTANRGPYARVWWTNRLPNGYNAEWTRRWQKILTDCRAILDEYEAETGHHMTLASDLGNDYSFYNKPILDFLNREDGPLDYLVIMNYYDNRPNENGEPSFFYGKKRGEQVVGGVVNNLEAWDRLPLMFAVETGATNIAQDWQSFHQEGYRKMEQTIDTLMTEYGAQVMGVAIHHYPTYRTIEP